MNLLLEPISEKIFKEKVTIRFNNINDGFNRFLNFILEGKDEPEIIILIEEIFKLNEADNSFVDFYFSRLNEDDKERLVGLLNDEDKEILKAHIEEIKDETIFFKLSKEIIPFITRLSTREILFCTFYFTKLPCTIWGNYNMKFPMFFSDKDMMEKYKDLAAQRGV